MAYTPGPWTMKHASFAFHIFGLFKKSQNAFITCAYWSNTEYGASKAEAEANAKLISAAPDLLKALERIVANPEARIGGEIRAEAITAINKATGAVDFPNIGLKG